MTVGNKAAADDAVVFVSIAQYSEIISHSGLLPEYRISRVIFFAYMLLIALIHSDGNELYLPFWKIVSFRWSDNTLKKMILGFCSFSGDKLKLVVEHQMRSGKEEEL
jgi:hypothetical protein